jgi:hypothetical protein
MARGAPWQGCRTRRAGTPGPGDPYTPGAMAQPKQTKKPRSRSDPARREAAARRDEARRLAAEERRREQEAAERRQKLKKTARRMAVPALAGLGVVIVAVFLFGPEKELAGVEKVDTTAIMAGLGYVLPGDIDTRERLEALPVPVCGVVEDLTAEQLYSDLRNGAVVLFHRPDDTATAGALAALAADFESHIVVASSDRLTQAVLAVSWGHREAYDAAADPGLAEFADVYRQRGKDGKDCPLPGA